MSTHNQDHLVNSHQTVSLRKSILPGEILSKPLVIISMVLWAINDHYGKGHWPPYLSGKISDICGLFVFPLWLIGGLECLLYILSCSHSKVRHIFFDQTIRMILCLVCIISVVTIFIGINISSYCAEMYAQSLGELQYYSYMFLHMFYIDDTRTLILTRYKVQLTMDVTDTYCCPIVLFTLYYYHRFLQKN